MPRFASSCFFLGRTGATEAVCITAATFFSWNGTISRSSEAFLYRFWIRVSSSILDSDFSGEGTWVDSGLLVGQLIEEVHRRSDALWHRTLVSRMEPFISEKVWVNDSFFCSFYR